MYGLAHKLAWNFCRTRLLITAERDRLRAWTCCKPPTADIQAKLVFDDSGVVGGQAELPSLSQTAASALHWVNLISGEFFRHRAKQFEPDGRADALLLANLRCVRTALLDANLPKDVCHDLLARLIFVQFLFHRKDKQGNPFLDDTLMQGRLQGRLSRPHDNLESILTDRDDTYALFRWLNDRFNGDLFPGKGSSAAAREREWEEEKDQVEKRHLDLLADFVSGRMHMERRQPTLWREYSFDTIPLEFISSVYEQFVSEDADRQKAYYTPAHLVDFVLDRVIPWDDRQWNLKILDPACGSGIFLVKAFQRLVHRWRKANHGKAPRVSDLKPILENNLFGVDTNHDAVRVASFSLYLAMCDAIDPRYYWKQVVFPRLRGVRMLEADFFDETACGIQTRSDKQSFDVVVGNPPWGDNTAKTNSKFAEQWAKENAWPVANADIGPLFLAKAAALAKRGGKISLLQPATVVLFNKSPPAQRLRTKLFSSLDVEEIGNLSALRFGLFSKAVGPTCIITARNQPPDPGGMLEYIVPKPSKSNDDEYRVAIEPRDVNVVHSGEARSDPLVWSAFSWGGRRDLALLHRLQRFQTLEKLESLGHVETREGIIRGDRQKRQTLILGKPMLERPNFPERTFLRLSPEQLEENKDPWTHSADSTDFTAFQTPQLILKQSPLLSKKRFQAALNTGKEGVLCTQSYLTIHAKQYKENVLQGACLSYNSKLAVYFMLLSSGRFAAYRQESLAEDLLRVPLPEAADNLLDGLVNLEDVDNRVRALFRLNPSEWALVEDLFDFTLPDFKGGPNSPGRQRTIRKPAPGRPATEPDLQQYAAQFIRVLKSGFGDQKRISATIFQEPFPERLPVRLVAIHLHWPSRQPVQVEPMGSESLRERLAKLYADCMKAPDNENGFHFERSARIYAPHATPKGKVPTVFLIKPDQRRQWTVPWRCAMRTKSPPKSCRRNGSDVRA